MYRNIDGVFESVKYNVENTDEHIDDIMHEVVDTEVSRNSWFLNHQIIEIDYDSDIITAIINYKNEYGDFDIIDRNNAYARLAYPYIMNDLRKLWDEHLEELNDN